VKQQGPHQTVAMILSHVAALRRGGYEREAIAALRDHGPRQIEDVEWLYETLGAYLGMVRNPKP
jgi:hypothetical protein